VNEKILLVLRYKVLHCDQERCTVLWRIECILRKFDITNLAEVCTFTVDKGER
jgi:hypothetical protein